MNWRQEFLPVFIRATDNTETTQRDGLKGVDGLSMEARLTSAMVKEFRTCQQLFKTIKVQIYLLFVYTPNSLISVILEANSFPVTKQVYCETSFAVIFRLPWR